MRSRDLPPVGEYFGRGGRAMAAAEMESEGRVHVRQMSYNINCNWKVLSTLWEKQEHEPSSRPL